jgi:hypothetical protein
VGLQKKAIEVGYLGASCLYFTEKDDESLIKTDESMYVSFGESVAKAVSK